MRPAQAYAPALISDGGDLWGKLCTQSRAAQLKAVVAAIKAEPRLAVNHTVCVYHTAGLVPDLHQLGFLDYQAGQDRLQRSDSCIFYANDNNGNLSGGLQLVTRMLKKKQSKRGTAHALIMPCWSHQQFSRADVDDACQSILQGKWTLLGIYSTAPMAQCGNLARQSSPESMSTGSDSDADTNIPVQQSQVCELLPHLVIGFSIDKKQKRQASASNSEDLVVANRRRISISDTAADSSGAAGPAASPASVLASPSSKPLSPMSSLCSIPEQVGLRSCLPTGSGHIMECMSYCRVYDGSCTTGHTSWFLKISFPRTDCKLQDHALLSQHSQ